MKKEDTIILWDRFPDLFSCVCRKCKHLIELSEACTCAAFPDEDNNIPDEIIYFKNDHSQPLPGQKNNIVFERREFPGSSDNPFFKVTGL